jgi:hypothetical protein
MPKAARDKNTKVAFDAVDRPKHYNVLGATCAACDHPIECIDVTRHMDFNIGNVVKYCWRKDHKNGLEDLKKARWYLDDKIRELERSNG